MYILYDTCLYGIHIVVFIVFNSFSLLVIRWAAVNNNVVFDMSLVIVNFLPYARVRISKAVTVFV